MIAGSPFSQSWFVSTPCIHTTSALTCRPHPANAFLKQPAISQARHHKWCVLVMVGANLFEQRRRQRDYCRPKFYHPNKNLTIQHIFVAGIPSYDERPVDQKVQGQLATAKEINVSLALLEEQRLHGDMYVTPHRDYYRDLAEKRLGLLKYGVENGCDYIFLKRITNIVSTLISLGALSSCTNINIPRKNSTLETIYGREPSSRICKRVHTENILHTCRVGSVVFRTDSHRSL